MGIYGIQLIEHGGGGVSHWGQVQCANCGAWLKEMPDRYEKKEPLFKDALQQYLCYWTCLDCGTVR